MAIPYAHTTAGMAARNEIIKILRNFGCESVGFMDEFETRTVILAFKLRGQPIQLRASAQGWANAWLKENPWTERKRISRKAYELKALDQGMKAVNSVLRDWVKGQITAIETGILALEDVFLPYMITSDGETLGAKARTLLLNKPDNAELICESNLL
jgi:hypothetical protein